MTECGANCLARQEPCGALSLGPDGDFVAVRVAEVKSPSARETLTRDDLRARGSDLRLQGVEIGREEHDQRPALDTTLRSALKPPERPPLSKAT